MGLSEEKATAKGEGTGDYWELLLQALIYAPTGLEARV